MQAYLTPQLVETQARLPAALLRGRTGTGALPTLPPCPPTPQVLVKVRLLAGVGLFSAFLTRQVAPGDGWCRQPDPVGLLGAGLAGSDGAQKELAPGRVQIWL